MFEPGSSKFCSPYCRFMRCARNMLIIKGKKRVCGLTSDACDPKTCQFTTCAINKLILPEGECGLWHEKHRRRKRLLDIMDVEDIPGGARIRGLEDYL